MLQLPMIFGDKMIVQREKPVPVWGSAAPGQKVTVRMQGLVTTAIADETGNWRADCGPFCTSFDETMEIVTEDETLTFSHVQVGEVWLAGGQSNMEFHMRYDADMEQERAVCGNPNIRLFDYPEVSYPEQLEEADYSREYGFWRTADPEELERFPAAAYYFAKELQARYRVPIGLVGCNWGGTPACAWMPEEAILEGGGKPFLDDYAAAVRDLDLEDYDRRFRACPGIYRTDQLADPMNDEMMFGQPIEALDRIVQGIVSGAQPQADNAFNFPMGPKHERRPAGLYRSMLCQVAPYALRGFLYYQGETDGDAHPECYQTLFPALIRSWRSLWGEELPFLFVQIAPLDRWMFATGDRYAQIREAQDLTARTVPGTGMAVITDVGMRYDIHPKKKQPVGHRLALLAEAKVYGEPVLCEAPELTGAEIKDGALTLRFDHAGEGLELREVTPSGEHVGADRLGGLQIFQDGKELDLSAVRAKAEGSRVILSGGAIRAGSPTTVKLARTGWYCVNLYNSAGIPAKPAEVDAAL